MLLKRFRKSGSVLFVKEDRLVIREHGIFHNGQVFQFLHPQRMLRVDQAQQIESRIREDDSPAPCLAVVEDTAKFTGVSVCRPGNSHVCVCFRVVMSASRKSALVINVKAEILIGEQHCGSIEDILQGLIPGSSTAENQDQEEPDKRFHHDR